LGIDTDNAQMISNMIPVDRGFNWTLNDTYYGNQEKGRYPIAEFKNEIDKYDKLLETALMIEGVIINRGIHPAGVFIINDDVCSYNAIMKSKKLVRTSQFELHNSEQFGLIKYDLLTTKALTKIRKTLEFIIEDGLIKPEPTLKETYNKYLHPMKIQYDNPITWELIGNNEVVDLFQFDTSIAISALNAIKPKTLVQLAQANSLLRLQQQMDAKESPIERFVKFRDNIKEAYKEMDEYGVPKEDQIILEKILLPYSFVADTQETIMALVRIPELTAFTVAESHELRKAVGKKSEKVFEGTRKKFFEKGLNKNININTLNYIWEGQITLQKGYGFSILHCISYTFIALQQVYLYQTYSPVYWNCACLTVNSGSDDEYGETKKSTNYGKIATAIANMQNKGIKVDVPHINSAKFGFTPDVPNNRIIFGIKGVCGVGDNIASAIISNQPYTSFDDFLTKMNTYKNESEENKFGDSSVITLIKAGCFDELESNMTRVELMEYFIRKISSPLTKLDISSIIILNELNLLTDSQKEFELRLYKFRKYIFNPKFFTRQSGKSDNTKYYILDQIAEPFFFQHFETNMVENKDYEYNETGNILIKKGSLDREFKKLMSNFEKEVLADPKTLIYINNYRFQEKWNEKVEGTISKWEMDSLSFYYHEHELAHVNKDKYMIVDYNSLPEVPEVVEKYMYKGVERPRFKLSRICGTVLDKDKNKHIVSILTTTGVVNVKFYKGQFGFYDKQISAVLEGDTKKTVLEKSWFGRGQMCLVTGFRRGDSYVPKKYADSAYRHTVQLITSIDENGDLILQSERTSLDE
jgi:DNA polymerase-3 subunit alpha